MGQETVRNQELDGASQGLGGHSLAKLSLAALGVVYGDIGTSPLYAIRECFHGKYGIAVTADNVFGVLSLIFWALIIIVSIKYLTFILKADNQGEGGVMALTALVQPGILRRTRARWFLVVVGVFGAALLYGDGMITPAISVMSAVEGMRIITPVFKPFVVPATIVILGALFFLQRRGTAGVGALFGPVVLVWFSVIAVLGLVEIIRHPHVLAAVAPWYGLEFLVRNQLHGFLVLGAVCLVVTGAEALYADLGHFGRGPIRLSWIALVLPALLLNYFGQGALLISRPEVADHPFYGLVPSWAMVPMLALATAATIIASQAVITGAFSLTRQAIQLGYLPRLTIVHTSARHMGQIYVPQVNWLLMVCTIGLVLGFRSSSKLAAAYGVAVTSTMLVSTILFYVVVREKWGWNRLAAGFLVGLFLLVDCTLFSANVSKIMHGAWFPLAIGGIVFILMTTWRRGRELLAGQLRSSTLTLPEFQETIKVSSPSRVTGQAIFMTGNPDVAPAALVNNLKHNKILHSEIALLHFITEEIPRVPMEKKVSVNKLGGGFYKIVAHFGFMEYHNIGTVLTLMLEHGLNFTMEKISFFLGRERIVLGKKSRMSPWRTKLFAIMSRNAQEAAIYYNIPADQVIEVGVRLEI
jgi:KUP system potassium uptake protein